MPAEYLLRRNEKAALVIAPALCLQWLVCKTLHLNLPLPWEPLLPGLAIFGAAFLLSWSAELAQHEIPQALALAMVALVAVLPEYAVDMYFAWTAGKDPTYTAYATANMTGGNRLLVGAGWAAVVFASWFKSGHRSILLEAEHRLELLALLAATGYSLVIPFKKTLSWVDSAILITIFAVYLVAAARSQHTDPDLNEGPAAWLSQRSVTMRRLFTAGFFVLAGYSIYAAAHPFAEGLLAAGRHSGIEEFLLVQWLAPLASESPEFIVAILFALRNKPGAGFTTLVSSKVNQWTLLIGMLPLAYGLSAQSLAPMHLDSRQVEEILLTSAQSLFAIILICDLKFSIWDGLVLFGMFITQFFFVQEAARMAYAGVYLLLAVGMLIFKTNTRNAFFATLHEGFRKIVRIS